MYILTFSYSFGNSNIFYDFSKMFNDDIKMIPLDYPAHGRRMFEEPLFTVKDIVDDMFEQVKEYIYSDKPYCLMGYSMGGIIAYELYQKIAKKGLRLPHRIFIFATTAPDEPQEQRDYENYNLAQIKEELAEMDGTPQEILDNDEYVEMLTPMVKADCIVLRDYKANEQESLKVECGVTVVRGNEEDKIENCKSGWRRFIKKDFEYVETTGKHFFLFDNDGERYQEFVKFIEERVRRM